MPPELRQRCRILLSVRTGLYSCLGLLWWHLTWMRGATRQGLLPRFWLLTVRAKLKLTHQLSSRIASRAKERVARGVASRSDFTPIGLRRASRTTPRLHRRARNTCTPQRRCLARCTPPNPFQSRRIHTPAPHPGCTPEWSGKRRHRNGRRRSRSPRPDSRPCSLRSCSAAAARCRQGRWRSNGPRSSCHRSSRCPRTNR